VTEALDTNGIEFGIARLIEVIQGSADESAQAVVAQVTDKVRTFVGSQPQNDDITLVAIRKV
jgi:sigma-B regulation protein RsbU (phosphoserine phosphatase)